MSFMNTAHSAPAAATSPAGSIYDLGYRHYDGPRRGRLYAMWSLYVESLRGVWGFGRPMTAKAVPLILAGLYAIVAVIQLAFSSVFANAIAQGNDVGLVKYSDYFQSMYIFVFFFCVAQAPEVVCRDQRYTVLPLYFTRAMGRIEYSLARLASFATALFVVLMIPNLALFIGDVLMKPDAFQAVGDEIPKFLPSLPASVVIAIGLAAISLAVSAFTPRRAYAAIGIVAYVLIMQAVPAAIYSVGQNSGWTWADKLFAVAPIDALDGATAWFFGAKLDPNFFLGTLTTANYLVAALASAVIFTGVLMLRYRKVPA
jgi:ABC-2 type transport system permease protein